MKIIELRAENLKRIKAIEIKPKDNMVLISGRNEQGKTSVLDSIWFALAGKDSFSQTPRPIRDGQNEAFVTVDLGDMIVTRHWTSNKRSYLKVENKEGERFNSPQELLDGFVGKLSFDPLEFSTLNARDQREMLLDLTDLKTDIDALDANRTAIYDERTTLGRDLTSTQAQLEHTDLPADLPEEELSLSELSRKLEAAIRHNREIEDNNSKQNLLLETIARDEANIDRIKTQIVELNLEIKRIEFHSQERQQTIERCKEYLNSHSPINTEEIKIEINEAEDINRLIRASSRNNVLQARVTKLRTECDSLTEQLTLIDKAKIKALREASMPIEGLGIDEDGVTFDDMPFSQIGSANQLKVSMAIAMAMNPHLRVIRIERGNDLDKDNLAIIEKMAKDNDFQIWIEKVDDTGTIGFYIEDGELVGQARKGK